MSDAERDAERRRIQRGPRIDPDATQRNRAWLNGPLFSWPPRQRTPHTLEAPDEQKPDEQ